MATSSITKNFVISGKEQVEAFADAIEAAANDKTPVHKVSARVLTDPKDIAKFMQKRKKANEARLGLRRNPWPRLFVSSHRAQKKPLL